MQRESEEGTDEADKASRYVLDSRSTGSTLSLSSAYIPIGVDTHPAAVCRR